MYLACCGLDVGVTYANMSGVARALEAMRRRQDSVAIQQSPSADYLHLMIKN